MPSIMRLATLLLLLLLHHQLADASTIEADIDQPADSEEHIGALLDPRRYNKNHRPPSGSAGNASRLHQDRPKATDVLVNLHIVSFSTLSVQNMDFTVNMYLRMVWTDPRLAYASANPSASVSLHSMKDRIWMPDIFFRNAKQVENHADPVPNILVKLQPSGRIYFSQKLKVRLWCLMDLRDFPMDCQTCRIEIGAYGSSVSEVRFHWHQANVTFEDDAMQIPEFSQPHVSVQNCTKSFSVTGEFACLRANVRLRRAHGFYLMNTYAPFTLMVCISWISFWIDVRATPARVTIAFLTVLAVVTQNAGTQMTGMPRVSYVKAIDLFMMASLMFVIAALMEFAAASFLTRQHEKELGEQPSRRRRRSGVLSRHHQPATPSGNGVALDEMLMTEERARKLRSWCYRNPRVNRLDYCSRFLFPLAYCIFQAVYWAYYLRDRDNCGPA